MKTASGRWLLAVALVAVAACLLLPISNPDLFWHLSAARRMAQLRAIPTVDWLSSTMSGAFWTDFEWLSQLIYGALYRLGGLAALWLFKIFLLVLASAVLWRTLRVEGAAVEYRAAALALWSAAFLTRSDIRPELFSVLGFGLVFWALESRRSGGRSISARWAVPFFGLWANLHAGYAYGLLLITLYAVGDAMELFPRLSEKGKSGSSSKGHLARHLLCAFIGTFIQPFGWNAYTILWEHGRDLGSLSHYIAEWGGLGFDNPWYWPTWPLLLGGFGTAMVLARRRRLDKSGGPPVEPGPLLAMIVCGVAAFRHARLGAYYATLVLPLSMDWALRARMLPRMPGPRLRRALVGIAAICAGYSIWWGRHFGLMACVFSDRFAPVRAAAFLDQEQGVLAGRPLYNPWGWGGYLGWRLYPRYRVFQDGRYIFHPLLLEAARAVEDGAAWREFLERRHIEAALMENMPMKLSTTRAYPDGSTRTFLRPYYTVYMSKERWALVHWDDKALVFVRRDAMPKEWLKSHEYRYALPFDREAREDAVRRGEIPDDAVQAEFRRHDEELSAPVGAPRPGEW